MIAFIKKGNILDADTEALVNAVNTQGVMGAGVALQFKKAFPDNFKLYEKTAKANKLNVGKIFVTETGKITNPKYIINFPTKQHWRYPSKYEWIEEGLQSLKGWLKNNNIKSIAIPPLGSGNGKLDWNRVKKMILDSLKEFENKIDIIILEPSLQFESKPTLTKSQQKLTPARAMLLYIMHRYQVMGYEINLLVVQKIAYFLQRLGEPLRLKFEKGYYGPFAYNLIPVLKAIRPDYINYKSLGDAKPSTVLRQNQNSIKEVFEYFDQNITEDQKKRVDQTLSLIKDFETPFGLELLGTIDYIFNQKNSVIASKEVLVELKNWTERKQKLFKEYHIEVAKNKLLEYFNYN